MSFIGIPIGVVIGVLAGVMFLVILETAFKGSGIKHMTAVIAELAALATFSFGGSWLTKGLLKNVAGSDILPSYLCSFAVTFLFVIGRRLFQVAITMGNESAKREGPSNA